MSRVSREARAMLAEAFVDGDWLRIMCAVKHFKLVRMFERGMEQR